MSQNPLECSTWPAYQVDSMRRSMRTHGRAYVARERQKVLAIRAAAVHDSGQPIEPVNIPLHDGGQLKISGAKQHPDLPEALEQIDIVLQRFALILDGGRA